MFGIRAPTVFANLTCLALMNTRLVLYSNLLCILCLECFIINACENDPPRINFTINNKTNFDPTSSRFPKSFTKNYSHIASPALGNRSSKSKLSKMTAAESQQLPKTTASPVAAKTQPKKFRLRNQEGPPPQLRERYG